PAALRRLAKQDGLVGWGYTVYLPWTKRSPDLTKLSKVTLRLRYQPTKGAPLFTENDITLSPMNGTVNVQNNAPPMQLPQVQTRRCSLVRRGGRGRDVSVGKLETTGGRTPARWPNATLAALVASASGRDPPAGQEAACLRKSPYPAVP